MEYKNRLLTNSDILELVNISKQAGIILLSYFGRNIDVTNKKDNTPVTKADVESSKLIISKLKQISEFPIISEECLDNNYEHLNWDTFWLIDPLDGTKNFIKGSPEFCICISLINKNSAVFGLIYSPVTDECWYGQKDCGVFKVTAKTKVKLNQPNLEKVIVTTGSYFFNDKLSDFLRKISTYEHYAKGCALKYIEIAEGRASIYPRFGNTSEWDTSAGQVILNELGGDVISVCGMSLAYGKKKSFLNPNFIAFLGEDVEKLIRSII